MKDFTDDFGAIDVARQRCGLQQQISPAADLRAHVDEFFAHRGASGSVFAGVEIGAQVVPGHPGDALDVEDAFSGGGAASGNPVADRALRDPQGSSERLLSSDSLNRPLQGFYRGS